MISVLIADDRYAYQQILQSYIELEPDLEVIGIAVDGQAAIELVEKLKPDVVIMDIKMPKIDGLTATEIITNRYVDTKILIFSVCDDVQHIRNSLQIGAKGYLLKNTHPKELVSAIRTIHQGYCQLGPGLIEKLASDTSLVPKKQFNHAHHSSELINQSKSEVLRRGPSVPSQARDSGSERGSKMEGLAEYTSAACKPRRDAGSQGTETGIEEGSSGEVSSPACEPRFESLNAPHIAPKAASTSSNSVVVLPQWKSKKLVYLNLGLLVSAVILVLASSHLKFMPLNNWLGLSKFIQNDSESKAKASNLTRVLPVVTQKVVPVDSYQLSRIYTGSLVARRKSVLGFDRSGKLVKVAVEEGDRVLSGQPLAYLDTRNLKAERRGLLAKRVQAMAKLEEMEAGVRPETIAAAQASVKDLNEQLELARQKSSRRAKLYAQGAISLEQMDEAANQANVTLARLEEAQSKLDELLAGTRSEQIKAQKGVVEEIDASLVDLDVKLDQSIIKAPFAGIISARQVDEGTVVAAGESILHLIERGALEARVGIPVKAASLISVGSYQSLRIGSKTYPARVTAILPELDTQTRTMTVVLALEESLETKVKSGQVVRLKLSEQIAQSGYWLPTTSLVQGTHGLWSCYVLGKSTASDNTFSVEPRDVEILHTESDRVLVRGSLQANEQVVVNGIHRLFPGQLVKPVDERA